MDKAFAPYIAEEPGFALQMRVDYADFMEQLSSPPPIAFGSRQALDKWVHETIEGVVIKERGAKGEGMSFHGSIGTVPMFEQIWVKAKCKDYRHIMRLVAYENYSEESIRGLDADHVLAKTIISNMPDAWVAIFPVAPKSNQQFGNVEKNLQKYDPLTERVDLTPLATFKILSGKFPKNIEELRHAMCDIRGQLMKTPFTGPFMDEMERKMEIILNNRNLKK